MSDEHIVKITDTFFRFYSWHCTSRHNGVHFFDILIFKSGPNLVCFVHFAFKCVSRYNGVYFFDILTSKNGPKMMYFDLEMYFVLQ